MLLSYPPASRVLLLPLLCFALWPLTFSCSGSRCKGVGGSYLHTPLPLHQFSTAISPTWKSFLRSTFSLSYYKRTIFQQVILHSPFTSYTQTFSGVGEVGNLQSRLLTENWKDRALCLTGKGVPQMGQSSGRGVSGGCCSWASVSQGCASIRHSISNNVPDLIPVSS